MLLTIYLKVTYPIFRLGQGHPTYVPANLICESGPQVRTGWWLYSKGALRPGAATLTPVRSNEPAHVYQLPPLSYLSFKLQTTQVYVKMIRILEGLNIYRELASLSFFTLKKSSVDFPTNGIIWRNGMCSASLLGSLIFIARIHDKNCRLIIQRWTKWMP